MTSTMRPGRRRAIALVLTLVLSSLLLMLTTAFFSVHIEQIRFQSQTQDSFLARQAALSGLDYARMRLESDAGWGIPKSNKDITVTIPGLRIVENDSLGAGAANLPKSFNCVGVLGNGNSHFQISLWEAGVQLDPLTDGRYSDPSIAANPATPSSWTLEQLKPGQMSMNYIPYSPFLGRNEAPDFSPSRTVIPGEALLQIRGYAGGVIKTLEVTLGAERPTEASIQAGGTMAVDTGSGTWFIGSVVSGKNRVEAGSKMLVSGGAATPNVRFLSSDGVAASNAAIQASSNGVQQVLDLGDGQLQINMVDTPNNLSIGPANSHSGGKFAPDSGVSSPPDLQPASVQAMMSNAAHVNRTLPGGNYEFIGPNSIRVNGGTVHVGDLMSGPHRVGKIENYRLVFEDRQQIEFSGPTRFTATNGAKPSVLLGYDQHGYLPWDSEGTFLKVTNGNLDIDGSLSGKGSVMTTGNSTTAGSILMRGKSQMSADPDSDVTLYAERNIKVTPPDPTSADFFSVDLAAISQSMNAYAPGPNPWSQGARPLNQFASLAGADQDQHIQGGSTALSDAGVSNGAIKSAPITANLSELKAELESQFPVLADATQGPVAQAEFNRLYDMFMDDAQPMHPSITAFGMTAGRYVRLREFLRELQRAYDAGDPLPTSDLTSTSPPPSTWADVTANNEIINGQLKAEISYFHRQVGGLGFSSLRNLVTHPTSNNPANNPLTAAMNARDARWTGLMYARGSVAIDTGGGSLDVRGSLVARNELAVTNSTRVSTTYDPVYLQNLSRFAVGSGIGQKMTTYVYRMR